LVVEGDKGLVQVAMSEEEFQRSLREVEKSTTMYFLGPIKNAIRLIREGYVGQAISVLEGVVIEVEKPVILPTSSL